MKPSNSGNTAYFIVLITLLFIISCSKSKDNPTPNPPPPTPTNTSPVASFTVSPTSGDLNTVFNFDASSCSDAQTTMSSLQVRWDFNSDGTFDTEWSTTKTESGTFTSTGTYTAKLEVKDAGGLIASTTKSITVESGAFTDSRDGKVYSTITVGGITWIDDNLAYELAGKQITDASVWAGNTSYDAWCYYDNDKDSYGDVYGILYQFEAAIAAIPEGWHLPTELEIRALTESLGGVGVAGGKLKEEGTAHWNAPNTGATNSSGYTGIPGGLRDEDGAFSGVGEYAAFWSSTIYTLLDAWFWYLSYDESSIAWFSYPKTRGFTVRCVKDQDNNTAPTAVFTVSPASGDVNTAFTLDASTSSDSESADSDLYVRWDFDSDGTFDTEWSKTKTVSHTYTTTGTYTVKLEVEDEGGLVSSTTTTIVVDDAVVTNTAPSASLTVDPTTGDTSTGFYFDASGSSDTETASADLQVRWDVYNDGSFDFDWTTDKLMNLTFSNAGTYTIKVEVKDEGGMISSATITIVVTDVVPNTAPSASFTISPSSGDTDTNFAFDASASSDTETISANLKVRWDFDNDGTFEVDWTTAKTTTHTYSSATTYTVKMEVKDEGGLVSSDTKNVVVSTVANTAPSASFIVSPTTGYTYTNFSFDASSSSDTETANGELEVRWDFDNDGTFDVDWTTTKTTTHTYSTAATYTVKMEVRDAEGLVDSETKTIVVDANTAPIASFTPSITLEYINTNISFDASATSDTETASGDIEVRWDFDNDGTFEVVWTTTKILTHSFPSGGDFTVKLEVKDEGGLINSVTATLQIESGTFLDSRDNESYNTVIIDSQVWFAENLNFESSESWWYDDNSANGDIYGRHYTWDAAKTACPSGWHLPSDDEWKTLEMFLGMSQAEADKIGYRGTDEGEKMKSTSGWSNDGNGTNSSGFKALPGGARFYSSYDLGEYGYWWTATKYSDTEVLYRYLRFGFDQVNRAKEYQAKKYSVRCLKD